LACTNLYLLADWLATSWPSFGLPRSLDNWRLEIVAAITILVAYIPFCVARVALWLMIYKADE
jgi:hypothetical protein